jgi:hypothetical protein
LGGGGTGGAAGGGISHKGGALSTGTTDKAVDFKSSPPSSGGKVRLGWYLCFDFWRNAVANGLK